MTGSDAGRYPRDTPRLVSHSPEAVTPPRRHLVFIVSPGQRELFESLTRTFADDTSVQVILDRRTGERRQRSEQGAAVERRQADRRRDLEVQKRLSARGYAVVAVVAAKP